MSPSEALRAASYGQRYSKQNARTEECLPNRTCNTPCITRHRNKTNNRIYKYRVLTRIPRNLLSCVNLKRNTKLESHTHPQPTRESVHRKIRNYTSLEAQSRLSRLSPVTSLRPPLRQSAACGVPMVCLLCTSRTTRDNGRRTGSHSQSNVQRGEWTVKHAHRLEKPASSLRVWILTRATLRAVFIFDHDHLKVSCTCGTGGQAIKHSKTHRDGAIEFSRREGRLYRP